MSFLDLYQGDQQQALRPQVNEGHDLPASFGESFHAAWDYGRLFEQSNAHENARMEALQDHLGDIQRKSGVNVSDQMNWMLDAPGVGSVPTPSGLLLNQANEAVQRLKEKRPELDLGPLEDGDLDKRAIDKSRAAGKALADIAGREHSGLGLFAGGTAAAATDPINILALPVAPDTAGVGILAAALRWGGVAAVAQAGIEAAGSPYREDVQPGYAESGAPLANIATAFGGGAVLGGATKALGNLWTRAKTGAWPTSVKDAGNVLESEANVANHNVYDGAEGEAAHRDAMATSLEQVLKGEPVDVSKIITPEIEATARDAAAGPAEVVGEPKPPGLGAESFVAEKPLDSPVRPAEVPTFETAERPNVSPPEQLRTMLDSPEHERALQADIDRERVGDVSRQIPVDVDKDGNPIFRSLDDIAEEAEGYRKAAERLQACASPVQPEEGT